jgi:hypothetical protein
MRSWSRPTVRSARLGWCSGTSIGRSSGGDPRASYALVGEDGIEIRRVAYDVEREAALLADRGHPLAAWISQMLRAGAYVAP